MQGGGNHFLEKIGSRPLHPPLSKKNFQKYFLFYGEEYLQTNSFLEVEV